MYNMKTTKECPVCKKIFTRIHTSYHSVTYCSRSCANKAPRRMDEIKLKIGRKGTQHPNYKGGWTQRGSKGGAYFMKLLLPEERGIYPTERDGYIQRSHYVWNQSHSTEIVQRGEVIHHMNHNSLDDSPENLMKIKSQTEHARSHSKELVKHRQRDAKGKLI